MNAETFNNTLIAYRLRQPFKPFTVVLVNGRQHEIDFPDAIVHRKGVAIYVGPEGVPVIFDHEGVTEFVGDLKTHADAGEV